jgi:hypothetical protein
MYISHHGAEVNKEAKGKIAEVKKRLCVPEVSQALLSVRLYFHRRFHTELILDAVGPASQTRPLNIKFIHITFPD